VGTATLDLAGRLLDSLSRAPDERHVGARERRAAADPAARSGDERMAPAEALAGEDHARPTVRAYPGGLGRNRAPLIVTTIARGELRCCVPLNALCRVHPRQTRGISMVNHRSAPGMRLTAAGRAFLPHA
jgi:hypothetical protein